MKKVLSILTAGCILLACNQADKKAAEAPALAGNAKDSTSIQWIDSTYQDLGNVTEGQTVEVTYHFKNTGNKPLIIANATASCGCTVAEKPEEPVQPGKDSFIKAKFDSKGREGEQRKEVFVVANTKSAPNQTLMFRVQVEKK